MRVCNPDTPIMDFLVLLSFAFTVNHYFLMTIDMNVSFSFLVDSLLGQREIPDSLGSGRQAAEAASGCRECSFIHSIALIVLLKHLYYLNALKERLNNL